MRTANEQSQEVLANVRTLRGLLPIYAGCKRVRDDDGYWNHIESYVRAHSHAAFTQWMCPECVRKWGWAQAGSEAEQK